jgi:hypothetical protein
MEQFAADASAASLSIAGSLQEEQLMFYRQKVDQNEREVIE